MKQDTDKSLQLKLLLCLQMMLCSGLCILDRSLLSACHSTTDVRLPSSMPTTDPAFLPSLSRHEVTTFFMLPPSIPPHNSLIKHQQQLFADVEGCQPSEDVKSALSSPAQNICVGSPVQFVIQLHSQVFVVILKIREMTCHTLQQSQHLAVCPVLGSKTYILCMSVRPSVHRPKLQMEVGFHISFSMGKGEFCGMLLLFAEQVVILVWEITDDLFSSLPGPGIIQLLY